jgi:hypothetical protein
VKPVGLAVAVVLFRFTLKPDGYRLEHRCLTWLKGGQMFLFEPVGKDIQLFPSAVEDHFGFVGQGADLGEAQAVNKMA